MISKLAGRMIAACVRSTFTYISTPLHPPFSLLHSHTSTSFIPPAELVPLLHRQHPLVVAKHILPALSNLISSKVFASEEGRAAVTSLCEKLYECMGRDGIESTNYLTSQQLEKLRELMGMR